MSQDRFTCTDSPKLDIDGIYVTIIPEGETGETSAPPTKTKASKGKPKEVELLANAQLRLKEGTRYALFGRNGTGKSSKYGLFQALSVAKKI